MILYIVYSVFSYLSLQQVQAKVTACHLSFCIDSDLQRICLVKIW